MEEKAHRRADGFFLLFPITIPATVGAGGGERSGGLVVRLSKIYTKVGDGGKTMLGDGATASKHDARVEAYGSVDEANAAVGAAVAAIAGGAEGPMGLVRSELMRAQHDLFDVGADLCVPIDKGEKPGARLRVTAEQASRLEPIIDRLNGPLAPLSSFVLPGGSAEAAALHVARTAVRRAERRVAALLEAEGARTNPAALVYLNRLSDLLFVMARVANGVGTGDALWIPGVNRDGAGGPAGGSV